MRICPIVKEECLSSVSCQKCMLYIEYALDEELDDLQENLNEAEDLLDCFNDEDVIVVPIWEDSDFDIDDLPF